MSKFLKVTAVLGAILMAGGIVLAAVGWSMGGNVINAWTKSISRLSDMFSKFDGRRTDDIDGLSWTPLEEFSSVLIRADVIGLKFSPSEDGFGIAVLNEGNAPAVSYAVYDGLLSVSAPDIDWGRSGAEGSLVVITYPPQTVFEYIDVDVSLLAADLQDLRAEGAGIHFRAGTLNAEWCAFASFFCEANAADVSIENVYAEYASIEIDVGEIVGNNFNTRSLGANVHLGSISITGSFEGTSLLYADVGEVHSHATLPREYYNLVVENITGESTESYYSDAQYNLTLEVRIGEAEAFFD